MRILQATHSGEAGVAEVIRILQNRIRDSTWTIAFKALIVVHLMIREGQPEVTLSYLSTSPRKLVGVNNYTDGTWHSLRFDGSTSWHNPGLQSYR